MWKKIELFFCDMMSRANEAVRHGFLHLFSANCLTQLLGFGSLLVVTKILAPDEVGTLRIIQSYVAVCISISTFGQPTAIIKYCAEIKNISLRKYIFRYSVKVGIVVSACLIIGIILASKAALISQNELVNYWLPWYALLILPSAIFTIGLTYLQAIRQFKNMAVLQSILKIISVFFVILFTWMHGIAGYVGSVVFMMIISCIVILKRIDLNFLWKKTKGKIPRGFHFLARVSIFATVVGTLGNYVDIFFLDHFIADRDMVGYYALATIFIMIGTQFTGSVQSFITPYLAERSRDGKWLWNNMLLYQKYLSITMIGICLLIYLIVTVLVNFYYGPQYEIVLSFITIMLIQLWLHTTYSIVGCTLTSINKEHYNLIVSSTYLLLKCLCMYTMVNKYGIVGLILGQIIAEIPIIVFEYIIANKAFKNTFDIGRKNVA